LLLNSDVSPQQLDWTTSIQTSSDNLMAILNEILDQSKLEAGKIELEKTDFHLSFMISSMAQLFLPKITEKGLTLNIEVDKALPIGIHADHLRIGQILSNFLSNALKFTTVGTLTLEVTQMSSNNGELNICFAVLDKGIGLSEVAQSRLFNPFIQADSSTSRKYGGTGLGLSISKQLAQLMGGEIGVNSVEGVGSKFWFTILCRPSTSKVEAVDKKRSLNRWVASRTLKILVAEDTVVIQHVLRAVLEKLNHEVIIANNGQLAIEQIESRDFDLVLMDIRMPIMDGIEATQIIRAMDGEKSKLPIIALTADIIAGNINDYFNAGINDICKKPFVLSELLKSIDTLLGEEIHTSLPCEPSKTQDKRVMENEEVVD